MTPGGRLSAAIEILDEVLSRHRPAGEAARDWGRAHRFAGSGDRTAITNLVNAALRRRQSIAWTMDAGTPRERALGALKLSWGLSSDEIASIADGSGFAPQPLSEDERAVLGAEDRLAEAPDWVVGDYPEWLAPAFSAAFGNGAVEEGRGLAGRAPLNLRVNTLKSDRQQVLKALSRYKRKRQNMRQTGCVSRLARDPNGSSMLKITPCTDAAGLKFRMKARKSPPSLPVQRPECRWWTSVPAPVVRRRRSPRRCATRVESMPMIRVNAASDRSSSACDVPVHAMFKYALVPILQLTFNHALILYLSMLLAQVLAYGGAGPMRNGAYASQCSINEFQNR